jgi:cobalamin biosynthesis protein CobT
MATRRVETREWVEAHRAKAMALREARRDAELSEIAAFIAAHAAKVRHKPEHQRTERARVVTTVGTVLFEGPADKAYEYADFWNRGERLLFVEGVR